jgi:MFS family permease
MCRAIDSTFVGDLIPPRVRASDVSTLSGAWYVNYAVASFLAGWLIVLAGYGLTFVVFAVCNFASTLLLVGYFRRHPSVTDAAESSG